jgi:hypothetical protein
VGSSSWRTAHGILAKRSATSLALRSSEKNSWPKLGDTHLRHGLDLGIEAAVESQPGFLGHRSSQRILP